MIEFDLDGELFNDLEREARGRGRKLETLVVNTLEVHTLPHELFWTPTGGEIEELAAFLERLPGVSVLAFELAPTTRWRVVIEICAGHELAWRVVQELSFVLNYISVSERLPTVFRPLAKGWSVESTLPHVDPRAIAQCLESYVPSPEDPEDWDVEGEDEDQDWEARMMGESP